MNFNLYLVLKFDSSLLAFLLILYLVLVIGLLPSFIVLFKFIFSSLDVSSENTKTLFDNASFPCLGLNWVEGLCTIIPGILPPISSNLEIIEEILLGWPEIVCFFELSFWGIFLLTGFKLSSFFIGFSITFLFSFKICFFISIILDLLSEFFF